MNQEPIRIDFPSEMRVKAPDTDQALDAMKESFDMLARHLTEMFSTLLRDLSILKTLPGSVENLEKTLVTQFQLSVIKQMAGYISTHEAAIRADEKRIKALDRFLVSRLDRYKKETHEIEDRYNKLFDRVAQDNKEARANLDSHAYELMESVFSKHVQDRFSFIGLPALQNLIEHPRETALVRQSGLIPESFYPAKDTILRFIQQRIDAYKQVRNWGHGVGSTGHYELPVWITEIMDTDSGQKRCEIRLAESATISLDELNLVQREAEQRVQSMKTVALTEDDRAQLDKHLREVSSIPSKAVDRLWSDGVSQLAQ